MHYIYQLTILIMSLLPIRSTEPSATETQEITHDEAQAMARAVVRLFQHWALTDAQACTLLGGISEATYHRWKRGSIGRIGVDLQTRLSLLMGIHKALRIVFTEPQRSYQWIKKPNTAFNDQSALDILLRGQITDLMSIRFYLDATRG